MTTCDICLVEITDKDKIYGFPEEIICEVCHKEAAKMRSLYKTSIVIWSEFDPGAMMIEDLVRAVDDHRAAMSSISNTRVEHPDLDPDWENDPVFDEVWKQ